MQAKPLRPHRHRAILGLCSLAAVLPILVRGPSCGHDFDFHLLSWLEAAGQFAHFGYPHWAYTPAWNAGEPRFLFYPPLSWTLGALLGLVLPWTLVPAAFTWIALTLSGLTMHALARRYASPTGALAAATLYLANPYMLFTAYERTAYGELLAAAWLPLLFAAILAPRIRVLPIALPLALLWLTNAPAAVMGSYALAFLALLRLALPAHSPRPVPHFRFALTTLAGTLLGLALSAFYLVPAVYEQRFVQIDMAVIPGMRPAEHFLFHRMGGHTFDDFFHDQVVRTASFVSLTLLAAITLTLLVLRLCPTFDLAPSDRRWAPSEARPLSNPPSPIVPLALLTLLIAFLLTPPSLLLWNHIPKLAFLQFPWRLCALLGVILATLTAIALDRLRLAGPWSLIPVSLLLAVLIFPAWHLFHQRCDAEDSVPARVALFHSNQGTDPTDEYTPIQIDGDALHPGDPPFWVVPASDPNAAPTPHAPPGPAPAHLILDAPVPERLVLNLRQYPAWQIHLNGSIVQPLSPKRRDGLIAIALPAGRDTIDLRLVRTADQDAGLAIGAVAALGALGLALRRRL
jgi:hypothetical protein